MIYIIIIIIVIAVGSLLIKLLGGLLAIIIGVALLAAAICLIVWVVKIGILIYILRVVAVLGLILFGFLFLSELYLYIKYSKIKKDLDDLLEEYVKRGEFDHEKFTAEIKNKYSEKQIKEFFALVEDKEIDEAADKFFLEKTGPFRREIHEKANNELVRFFKTVFNQHAIVKKEIPSMIDNWDKLKKAFTIDLADINLRLDQLYMDYYRKYSQQAKNEFINFADESFITQKFCSFSDIRMQITDKLKYAGAYIQDVQEFINFSVKYYEDMIRPILSEKVKEAGAMMADDVMASIQRDPVNNYFSDMGILEGIEKCEQMLLLDKSFEKVVVNKKDCIGKYLFVNPAGGKNLIRREIEL